MSNAPRFRPNRSALLAALISSALATEAGAAAARVDFAHGAVTVSGVDGAERPLLRGAQLDSGDTVRTSDGRAQLRFSDGAYVSLQPNTEFSIREYRYDGKTDGSERGFFALTKGAIRTVTGLVGRVNRNRYRITTPTATVGIRGTGGVVQVLNDGSTLIVGTSGIWSLSNPAGSIDVPAGVSAMAPSAPEAPPQQSSQAPQAGPAPVAQEPEPVAVAQGEQRTATGEPVLLPAARPAAHGIAIASDKSASSLDTVASFDDAGRLTSAALGTLAYKLEPGGSHAEFRSDGILSWGRWIGPVSVDGTVMKYGTDQGVHYVVGLPTAVMPVSGSASYVASTGAGTATSPTDVAGGKGVGSFTGRIDVSFGASAAVRGSFDVAMPNAKYSWSSSATATGSSFVMAASNQQITTSAGGVSGCTSTCSAKVYGFFAGPGAERIGAGYNLVDSGTGANIVGAAAFQRQ